MDKQVDMQAFVGVDFDCEFAYNFTSPFHRRTMLVGGFHDDGWKSTRPNGRDTLYWHESGEARPSVRPRLNKPQAVKDGQISWIPHGLVWNAFGENPNYNGGDSDFFSLERVGSQELRDVFAGYATWIECIGAEPDYKEWANAHGVQVVGVSNG